MKITLNLCRRGRGERYSSSLGPQTHMFSIQVEYKFSHLIVTGVVESVTALVLFAF